MAKSSKSRKSKSVKKVVHKQQFASTAFRLSLVNAVFAALFVAIVLVLYIVMPQKENSIAEIIGWVLLGINVAVVPFIGVAAIILAILSLMKRRDIAQSIIALSIVVLSGIMFVASWGLSIS